MSFDLKATQMIRSTIRTVSILFSTLFLLIACISKTPTHKERLDVQELTKNQPEQHGALIKAEDVHLTNPLNQQWIAEGKNIYDVKCSACHKLNDEKLVGPGWKGVTQRRQPDWILNMITNVDIMLEKDIQAQKLLEECLVRMPNQNLQTEEARKVLEFQRSNDGEK
jgi:mono/diheme cytochrome c family protein